MEQKKLQLDSTMNNFCIPLSASESFEAGLFSGVETNKPLKLVCHCRGLLFPQVSYYNVLLSQYRSQGNLTLCLFINYAYICTGISQNLKGAVLQCIITSGLTCIGKQNMQAKDVYCVMALYLGLLVMNGDDFQHAQLSFIVFPLFNWLIRLLNPREPQSLRPVYMEGGGGPQIGEVTCCGSSQITSEIIWTGRLPHLSGLPHLPGVPHLRVNRPKKTFSLLNLPSIRLFTVPYFS